MEQRLQLSDIANGLVRRNNMPVKEAELFVRQFFECIGDNLFHDNIVKVKGLGTFKVVEVEARESVDVNSGQRITIDGHAKVSFTPDPVLRDAINKPFAEFQTVVLNENTPIEAMEALDLAVEPQSEEAVETEPQPQEAVEEEQLPTEVTEEEAVPEVVVEKDSQSEEQPEAPEEEQQPLEADPQEVQPEEGIPPSEQVEEPNVQDNPVITDMLLDEQLETEPSANPQHRYGFWRVLLPVLLSLIFFVVGYVVGYERPVSMPEWKQLFSAKEPTPLTPPNEGGERSPLTAEETTAKEKTNADSQIHSDSLPTSDGQGSGSAPISHKRPSEVLAYPQVEGGDYYIVGIKGTEVMRPGKTLLNISIKYYQSKDFVEYICVMNGIKNPDIVPLDMELKIPELKHK